MKLTFKRITDNSNITQQVYPVVNIEGVSPENSEEIEDVIQCSVSSTIEDYSTMTLTVKIHKDK